MVTPFTFNTPQQIIFGSGRVSQLPDLASPLGKRLFAVTGENQDRIAPQLKALAEVSESFTSYALAREPSLEDLEKASQLAKDTRADCIVGIGGGAAIDLGKAVAVMCTNPGHALDFLEVIGQGKPFKKNALPYIAVPTTAGTGAEATKNAVLYSPTHQVKVSMRHNSMLPTLALVDPELTLGMPPALTAHTGMDALTQVIEPFLSPMATPMTDAICRYAIPLAVDALPQAYSDPNNLEARENMALASLYGGMALANAKLGSVHGIAGPLGGMCPDAPHGAICARLLHDCLKMNYVLRKRGDETLLEQRYQELALMLTDHESNKPLDGIAVIHHLQSRFEIPNLSRLGLQKEQFPELIHNSQKSSSMKGNPIALSEAELEQILGEAF